MVEAKENSALHTHYLLDTLSGHASHLFPLCTRRNSSACPCATEEDLFLVRGDNGDPATPNAAEVSTSMSVKGQKGDGGNILAL